MASEVLAIGAAAVLVVALIILACVALCGVSRRRKARRAPREWGQKVAQFAPIITGEAS